MVKDVPHLVGLRQDDAPYAPMRPYALRQIVLILALALPVTASAQPAPDAAPVPVQTPVPSESPEPVDTQLVDTQLEAQRAIILNLEDSLDTRVGQGIAMLNIGSKPAIDHVINLLITGTEPSTKVVMCLAIQRWAQQTSNDPDARLVDPLLTMLDHPSDDVLQAASSALAQFQDPAVFESLRLIAGKQDAAMSKRGAALR